MKRNRVLLTLATVVLLAFCYVAVGRITAAPEHPAGSPVGQFKVYRYFLDQYTAVPDPETGGYVFSVFELKPDSVNNVIVGASLKVEAKNAQSAALGIGTQQGAGGQVFQFATGAGNPDGWITLENHTPGMDLCAQPDCFGSWFGQRTLPIAGVESYSVGFGIGPVVSGLPVEIRGLEIKIFYLDNAASK